MIRILAIGFGPEPGQRMASAQGALTLLAAEGWSPPGAALDVRVVARRWWPVDPVVPGRSACDAVLLFSESGREDIALVAQFARNAADPYLDDAAGYRWAGGAIAPGGRETYASTLRPQALARAIELSGIPTQATAQCDRGIANKTFFDLLASNCAAALVRLPISVETARADGRRAQFNRAEIVRSVQAAIGFAAASAIMQREIGAADTATDTAAEFVAAPKAASASS
jgi:hypothetical protein